ncbi:MAG: hypothetical protein ABI806_01280 [Candidatus Solibacter sp.]
MKRAILFVAFAALCGAQTTVNGGRDFKGTIKASGSVSAVDFSGAASTAPAKAGLLAARPTACTQGHIYFATDVSAGQNLYFCTTSGTPGIWTQMSGVSGGSSNITSAAGAPSGNCTPPAVYIDTTNQDLWFCGAPNSWKKPAADVSTLAALAGANTWTGYNNLVNAQWRPPEATVATLPASASNVGKVFMVTDAVSAGNCAAGGGATRELCRAAATGYECVGGCGGGSGGGASNTAYLSSLLAGPDLTRTVSGATHGFATSALIVAVYDNSSPREAINAGWSVNPATYDVTLTFATPQSNYYVVINGGVGPAGPAGPQGPVGPAGTSGSGSGSVNPSGTIAANRIATFADATGTVILDGAQHSLGAGYLSATKTVGAGGVSANLLCRIDATGAVVAPALGDIGILGVCVTSRTAAQAVEVATRGVITCVADNATTAGNIAIPGTATAGRCRDSGQVNTTGVALSTQVLGKILNTVTAGSLVSIELYGPGHYGAAIMVSDGGTGQANYTKGDLLTSPGGAVLNRLPVGSDGQALTADAASAGGVKWAGSTRRTCIIDNDSQSATPLSAAQITGRCEIPFAAHIVEVGVWGGTGTGTQTYTGATSVQLTRLRPNGGSTAVVLSGVLPTPGSSVNSNRACAVSGLSGSCANGLPSSSSISLAGGVPMAVNAGDIIYVSSATADAVQTWFTITITYTAD